MKENKPTPTRTVWKRGFSRKTKRGKREEGGRKGREGGVKAGRGRARAPENIRGFIAREMPKKTTEPAYEAPACAQHVNPGPHWSPRPRPQQGPSLPPSSEGAETHETHLHAAASSPG